jgi:hypothetical protein
MGGVVDSLLGGASKSKTVEGSLTSQTQDIGATRKTRGVTTATAKLLSDNVRRAIEGSVIALSRESGDNADAIASIAEKLATRAGGAEAAINAQSAAIVAKAKRDADLRVQRIQTDLAMQAGGSSANSYGAGAAAEAKVNENVDLAALEANLRIQARNTGTEELSKAVEAFNTSSNSQSTDVTALAQLLSVLKGANTTETQKQNTNEIQTQTNRGKTRLDSVTVGKGTTRDSPLQQFTGLISAANSGP